MGIGEKKIESGLFGNYFLKLVYIILTVLVSIIGYFITDKLRQIDSKLEKIEQLEQKVQALNKSQIQIMTHLKIPIPDYLYTAVYQNHNFPKSSDIPYNSGDKKSEYFVAADINKRYKFLRDKRL